MTIKGNMSLDEQEALLEEWRPELKFSQEENFLPMNVYDFINDCKLKEENIRGDCNEVWEREANEIQKKSSTLDRKQAKAEALRDFDSEIYYLQFVHEKSMSWLFQWITGVTLIFLLFVCWWSIQPAHMHIGSPFGLQLWVAGSLRDFSISNVLDFRVWVPSLDDIRIFFIGFLAVSWVWLRGSKRTHLAIMLGLANIVFFGTPIGAALGLMIVFWFLFTWILTFPINLVPKIIFSVVLTPFFLIFILDFILSFSRMATDQQLPFLPFPLPFWGFVVMALIISVVFFFVYTMLGFALNVLANWIFKDLDFWLGSSIRNEIIPVIVLLMASIIIFFTFPDLISSLPGLVKQNQMDHSLFTKGFSIPYTFLAIFAASGLFWFFLERAIYHHLIPIPKFGPLNPNGEKPYLENLKETGQTNLTSFLIRLNPQIIRFSLLAFLFSWLVTLYFAVLQQEHYIERFASELTTGKVILYPLLFLLATTVILLVTILLIGPSLPGFFMNLQSRRSDLVADRAREKYSRLSSRSSDNNKQTCWYHGRVVSDGIWKVLQYHYFYAYNDWRRNSGGINNHEGDWESVSIFLIDDQLYGIAMSQHHNGKFYFRDQIKLDNGHIPVYVALGSHANYFKADNYPTSKLVSGFTSRVLDIVDNLLQIIGGKDHGLPTELARGDLRTDIDWKCVLLRDPLPGWVQFGGLWGFKEKKHKDESGPKGPRWKREQDRNRNYPDKERPRWGMHTWKDRLLFDILTKGDADKTDSERKQALRGLINSPSEINLFSTLTNPKFE